MNQPKIITAGILVIGNEILTGRTQDINLNYLAKSLNGKGIRVVQARVLPDEPAMITAAVQEFAQLYDYVFTSGGIGPTHDDKTASSVAAAFEAPLVQNPEAVAMLKQRYRTPEELTSMRLKMAQIPQGATLIENPVTQAPGFQLHNVYVLAGVPKIMQAMVDNVLPGLQEGAPVFSETVLFPCGEGALAENLQSLQQAHPQVDIGSYPRWNADGHPEVSVVVRGLDQKIVMQVRDKLWQLST